MQILLISYLSIKKSCFFYSNCLSDLNLSNIFSLLSIQFSILIISESCRISLCVYFCFDGFFFTHFTRSNMMLTFSDRHVIEISDLQCDFRYQSLRRTLRASRRPTVAPEEPIPENTIAETTPTTTTPVAAAVSVSQSTPTSSDNSPNLSSPNLNDRQRAIQDSPGCQFILRRDFFQFVSNHNVSQDKLSFLIFLINFEMFLLFFYLFFLKL